MARVGHTLNGKPVAEAVSMAAAMADAQDPGPTSGEHIVTLSATFHSYTLRPRGDGFDVKFFVPLSESERILSLMDAFQRLIVLQVTRRARRSRVDEGEFVGLGPDIFDSYAGHDDAELAEV